MTTPPMMPYAIFVKPLFTSLELVSTVSERISIPSLEIRALTIKASTPIRMGVVIPSSGMLNIIIAILPVVAVQPPQFQTLSLRVIGLDLEAAMIQALL
jgi:hypothetical protein